jgi:hypothetical protein
VHVTVLQNLLCLFMDFDINVQFSWQDTHFLGMQNSIFFLKMVVIFLESEIWYWIY